MKKELKNPRFDRHEGIHSLTGKDPDCTKCAQRIKQTEKQWMIKPLMSSIYGKKIGEAMFNKSR